MTTVAEQNRLIAELSAVRDATECRHCGHPYKKHGAVTGVCAHFSFGERRYCRCNGFADPAVIAGQEQLELR